MKNIVHNPYLPSWEYIPDAEPRVFDGRLYVFGSHDDGAGARYCPGDYVCWSSPGDKPLDFRYEGVIYRKEQDPDNKDGSHALYAPDVVQGRDGRYYLFYTLDYIYRIKVAVCDEPAGAYEFLGEVRMSDGAPLDFELPFDPAVLVDGERIHLYYGFCPAFKMGRMETLPETSGCVHVELCEDMLTVKTQPKIVIPNKRISDGTGFEGHAFFEAASIRKIGELYHLVYASELHHELCNAVSTRPDGDFRFCGTIVSNGDVGYKGIATERARNATANIHGGLACLGDSWFIFYHRHTHGTQFSRQGCAEKVLIAADGSIDQVEMTCCGLSGGVMPASSELPAYTACNLYKGKGAAPIRFGPANVEGPYIVEKHDLPEKERVQYITNITDSSVVGFRYLEFTGAEAKCTLQIRGNAVGSLGLFADDELMKKIGIADLVLDSDEGESVEIPLEGANGIRPFFIVFNGTGSLEMLSVAIS